MTKLNILEGVVPEHFRKSAHIYRQLCATVASSLMSVGGGIVFGFTAVLLPQLKVDESYTYDKKYDSWIASISPLAMLFGCLFSGTMSDNIGRKMGQIVLIIPFVVGWVVMGLADNNAMMLTGRFITGVCTGAMRANTMVYIGEICDPKYRAIALFGPSLAVHIGCLISHTLGKYIYWKICCFLFMIPQMITLMMLLFLKESPLWLLAKGRLDEGIESFKLFRGDGEASEKELASVLARCKVDAGGISYKENLKLVISKPFLKSLATIVLLFIAVQWSGINTISFYAQEIFEKTFSGDIDAFSLVIATDCIRMSASLIVCVIAKMIPRKAIFVTSCFSITIVLLGLVTYLYLNPVGIVWVAVLCMVVYIAIASALTSIAWSFIAEIFPARIRGFGSSLSSAISFSLLFISVQSTPEVRAHLGELAMYAAFAIVTFVCGIGLIFILPDTNGKTLQDIEDELYKKKDIVQNNSVIQTVPSEQKV